MAAIASPLWTCRNVARLPEPRASSAIARPYATLFHPAQPYSSLKEPPASPSSPKLWQKVERELGLVPVLGCRRDYLLINKGAYPGSNLLLLAREEATDVDEIYGVRSLSDLLGRNGHVVAFPCSNPLL